MSDRIKAMRQLLFDALKANGTPGDWNHIINQIGMFSFTGLTSNLFTRRIVSSNISTAKQCEILTSKYHIFLTKNGRISMPGLSTKTVPYLANAIHDVVTNNQ